MLKGYKLRLLPVLFLVFSFVLAQSSMLTSARGEAAIQGVVMDALTGKPIPDAKVVIWDVYAYKRTVIETDAEGKYSFNVVPGNAYILYIYSDNEETEGFDYVPMKSYTFTVRTGETVNLTCYLVPGASVLLTGRIYDVRSRPARMYFVEVIDPLTGNPPIQNLKPDNFSLISSWGDSPDVKRMGLPRELVVIPAGVTVDLKVWTRSLTTRRPLRPVDIEFLVDNKGSHYHLSQGEAVEADLSWYSLRETIKIVRAYWDETWENLGNMESMGFYLGDLKGVMRSVRREIEAAEELWTQGKFLEAFNTLIEPYWVITVKVVYETSRMWMVAESSAVFMPLFPAFFAITMGFFLFEDTKKKMLSSCVFYMASFALLYYVYPGFQVVEKSRLLLISSSVFISVLFTVFGLPRMIKEPDVPSAYPLRAVLSVVFSMSKRNIKRRLSRGILTITSLAILVLAFTAFTSFGKALGILTEPVTGFHPPSSGILIKNLPLPWEEGIEEPYIRIVPEEVDTYREHPNVVLVSPLVWASAPEPDQPIGSLRIRDQEFEVFGILGIDPSLEVKVTNIGQTVISGNISDLESPGGVLISQEAADQLGVEVGDTLPFYLRSSGLYKNLTVVGIIDSASLSSVIDINGESILPFRKVTREGRVTYARVEASKVIILNWTALLEKGQPLADMSAISRLAIQLSDQGYVKEFVRGVVFSREYTVWVSANGQVRKFYLGEAVEMGGLAIVVPLLIVLLNVGLVMLSVVNERTREIFILTCVGFNPTHIASLFLAESIVMGLVGGGIGYLLGLSTYRLMSLFSIDIVVRQKLEWYWSVIGVLLSVGTAVLSAVRPATRASMKVTPSIVKKVKLSGKEKAKREEEIWRIYQSQRITMPVKIKDQEMVFFSSFFSTRMREMARGIYEKVRDYSESEVKTPEGDLVKRFNFKYVILGEPGEIVIVNELTATKKSGSEYYFLTLESKPEKPGIPGTYLDRTIRVLRDLLAEWEREREKILGET